jgi:hypothetical protein
MRLKQTIILISLFILRATSVYSQESVVKLSETYELANIILSLTEYCKSDKNEVNKNTSYYQEVNAHFDKFTNHPLIEKVNYSRELWDRLLSFRTDAVAFEFDNTGSLIRKHKFYAMGKEINEFEKHISLIEDFARKSEFRKFYTEKKGYLDSLVALYESSLYIPTVISFLSTEFKTSVAISNQIIVSPLVGRMHCQRYFDKKSTSFISIPEYIFVSKQLNDITEENVASGIHMFFTEVDHDYVNPASNKNRKQLKKTFDPKIWDKGSGYEDYQNATFNEYMTWAVYDIFVKKYFPNSADKVIEEWHQINVSRGFIASQKFGKKLVELYQNKSGTENIVDLYPKLMNWCMETSPNLDNNK